MLGTVAGLLLGIPTEAIVVSLLALVLVLWALGAWTYDEGQNGPPIGCLFH